MYEIPQLGEYIEKIEPLKVSHSFVISQRIANKRRNIPDMSTAEFGIISEPQLSSLNSINEELEVESD